MKPSNPSPRFIRLAQLLFTSDIAEHELRTAEKTIAIFNKAEIDFKDWIEAIEHNFNVFKNYHGKETALVNISDTFNTTMEDQKQKYEKIIATIKQAIELLNSIQDIEMQDMITNLTKTSEEFTSDYNELIDMQLKIGEPGFIQQFKDISTKVIGNSEQIFDVLGRVRDYMKKNILGEQSLS